MMAKKKAAAKEPKADRYEPIAKQLEKLAENTRDLGKLPIPQRVEAT